MTRIVIDTNIFISAMINENSRVKLNQVLENQSFDILLDDILLREIYEVITREKFRKYVSLFKVETFLELLVERCTFIETTSVIRHSPDPKDDFLLALCQDGMADYLLTGNKIDLLDLKQFGQTIILSLTEFQSLK